MTLNELLKQYRTASGYTQEELSEKLHVSRQAISNWERGETLPDIENIIALSKLYDVSTDELLKGVRHLKKPYRIGVYGYRFNNLFPIAILFSGLLMGTMTENVLFGVLISLSLGYVVYGSVLKNTITLYRNGFRKIEGNVFIEYIKGKRAIQPYSQMRSIALHYKPVLRVAFRDTRPDEFWIVFSYEDGSKSRHEVTRRVGMDLPLIVSFLEKQGIECIDPQNIMGALSSGIPLVEVYSPYKEASK